MMSNRLVLGISFMFLVGVGLTSGGSAGAGEPPQGGGAKISVLIATDAAPRVVFGAEKLGEALKSAGYQPRTVALGDLPPDRPLVVAARRGSALGEKLAALGLKPGDTPLKPQGFVLSSLGGGLIGVVGQDDSGTLYGLLELAGRVKAAGKLPTDLHVADAPAMLMRGPCIGLQKSQWIYDDAQYDFPVTPQNFPFFYDKPQWQKYLDFMVENRMNMLTLWNGHPFTSLLKLPKFPDAQELDDETLARNIGIFSWLTREADRRGIWVVQFFYNIHLSHSLVKSRKIQTLGEKDKRFNLEKPTPLASEYTRYCISEFIREYPNVGLMVCLGEPLKDEYDAQWLTETILPGVRDGMRASGLKEEPPVIVRAHSTEPKSVVTAALKTYKNIFTMAKFNDESLITSHPTGPFRQKHQDLIKLGSLHIMNVHLLHNLQPFRYGSPVFIQRSVKDMCDMGTRGLHIYPLNYWGWPDTPDKTMPRIHQLERDWIWFSAWARYAWNPDRGEAEEREYWVARLAEKYGTRQAGEKLLDAYVASGECLPRMHGRFGTGSGGYQIFTKGMTVPQLMFPERSRAYTDESSCRLEGGETLETYAAREWNRQPHAGETPPLALNYVRTNARKALAAADAAAAQVTRNKEEFERLRNDLNCILILTEYYAARIEAGLMVLRYGYSLDAADLAKALPLLEKSVGDYRKLAALTSSSYHYANSLQTHNITVPFSCAGGKNAHWQECLPYYEAELAAFKANVGKLEAASFTPPPAGAKPDKPRLQPEQLIKLFEPAGPLTEQILVGNDTGALQIRAFLKRRIPPLKLPPDRDQWSRESAALRRKILEAVIFKGIPPGVMEAGPKVRLGETMDTGHGYRIRKLAYEGYPGIWIPALLYLPKELKGKVPAILNPNGHEPAGKAVAYKQIRCINFAKRGMIALSYDWPGYGQLKRGGIDSRDDTNALVAHNNAAYLDLCGQSGVGVFYLIARRGLDVLLSLPNVDSRRIGMTGLSGGGWQTIILSALDERIRLAIPVAGYTDMLSRIENFSDTGDLEQNPPDLGLYADYSHLTALLAPRPTLLIYNHNDFFNPRTTGPRIYEAAMPFFKLFGAGDCFRFHDNLQPGNHNYESDNRRQAYRFISEHFLPKEQRFEQELDCSGEILTEAQATVSLPGKNATWQELALKAAERLPRTPLPTGQPTPAWANELRQKLKEVVRYPSLTASITELPGNPGQGADAARRLLFTIGEDWKLPALELPAENRRGTAVLVADGGKAAAAEVVGNLLHAGWQVVAVDLLLEGELRAPDWPNCQVAHVFETVGERILGTRAAQLDAVCRALAKARPGQPIKIVGVGAEASLAALVAGCFSDTAQTLALIKLPASLKGLFEQGVYQMDAPSLFCPGLLELAEIGHLTALAGRERVSGNLDGLKNQGVQALPAPAIATP